MSKKLPKARNANIVVQDFDKEVLIYDLNNNQAFCLNNTLAKVFNACDGKMTFADLKDKFQFSEDIIFLSLDELQKNNLLTEKADYKSPFVSTSRREAIRNIGLASMIALPVISSIIAPTALQAASGTLAIGATCSDNADCATGACVPTVGYTGPRPIICCVSSSAAAAPGSTYCSAGACSSNNFCCNGLVSSGTFACSAPTPNPCICSSTP